MMGKEQHGDGASSGKEGCRRKKNPAKVFRKKNAISHKREKKKLEPGRQ